MNVAMSASGPLLTIQLLAVLFVYERKANERRPDVRLPRITPTDERFMAWYCKRQ